MNIKLNKYEDYKKKLSINDVTLIDSFCGEKKFDEHISNIERKINISLDVINNSFDCHFLAGFLDYDRVRSCFLCLSNDSSISYKIYNVNNHDFLNTVYLNINSEAYDLNNKEFNVSIEIDLKNKKHIVSCYPYEFFSGTDLENIEDNNVANNITVEFLNDLRFKTKDIFSKLYSDIFLYNINLFYFFVINNKNYKELKNAIVNLNNVQDFIDIYNLTHDVNVSIKNSDFIKLKNKIDKKILSKR